MIKKIKKPISIVLALMMVVSLFAIVPITASADVGDYVPESDYLTFTAVEAGSSVTLNVPTGNSFQYDLNGTGLTDYTLGTEITLANVGDSVRFRGRNTAFNASHHVSIVGKVACSGNVMSLRLDEDGRDQGLSYGCYNYMFMDCTGLTAAPELPETTLANRCYESMFFGCTNLTVAPELPATALATGCYSSMFAGCTSLTTAPELWATTLATGCYERMFYACRSLTTAPELPATTLVRNCYSYMFAGCERLTTAPELPATELVSNCYSRMFYRCSNIKLSETQTAEYSIPYSVPSGGDGKTATDALNNMFYGTGGTFAGTPEINKIYYRPAVKYTVTWKNEDGTTIDTTSVYEGTTPTYDGETPEKAEDENNTYTFAGWSPEVTAVTGDVTYTAQFDATPKQPHEHDGITFEKWTSDNSLPTEAGNYVLTSDVTLSGTWNVPSGTTNLCLNGHGILLSGNDVYINVNKANLNVFDCNGSDTAHYITLEGWRGTSVSDIGTESTVDGNGNGTVKISGGYITGGNRITQFAFGGCLQVSANGNFAFNGGTIIGNKCDDKGGAIYTDSSSTLTVNGGSIVYNYAYWGGAVFSNGTTTINGGSISYNVANYGGGAIELEANTLNVFGGEIKYNRVLNQNGGMWKGGGIHAYSSTLNIKGNVIISDNYQGSGADANNLYLRSNKNIKVTLVGELSESAKIGVSMQSPGTFTNSADTSFNDPTKFFSDKSNYIVGKNAAGQLLLGVPCTVTWKNGDETLKTETVAKGTTPTYDGATPTKANDDYHSYNFSGWTDGTNTYGASDTLPAVTGDVTYTAKYTVFTKQFTVFVKTTTGKTITANGVSGDTTVAELKNMVVEESGIPAAEQRLIFAGKEMENEKTLADYRIQKESTIHVVGKSYTITWKNDDGTVIDTTSVAYGTVPTHDAYKADGDDTVYTFSGWTPEVVAVSGDAEYTATFTESEKPETIKDCNNKFGDFRLYANVPLVQFSGFEELPNGAVLVLTYGDSNTMIPVQDAKGYSYKFYDQTGTELTTEISESSTEPGSNFGFGDDVTVYAKTINFTRLEGTKAIYIVATAPTPAPAPAMLTLNVGENGKVVMDNGTFGNATNASNISEIRGPVNVADGYNASIANVFIGDGHSVNLAEGGSINIATGGKVSFYPSADNTGKITAIPNEGYICTGWYNGDTRYTNKDTINYQEISENMTLTAKFAPKLFPQHSVTLGGDIGVNFYINPAAANFAGASEATVKFTWDGGKENSKEVSLKGLTTNDDGYYKVTVDVVAAHVAHKIHAEVYLNGEKLDQTDDYSVQDYAEEVYKNPEKYDSEKPKKLKELAKALLNYGAMAQTVFKEYVQQEKDPADTVETVGKTNFNLISADDIAGEATDLEAIATQLGFKYYTSSVLYLSKNTLRLYFTPNTYQDAMPHVNDFKGNQSEYYYYVEKENIAAAELDEQQSFTIGDKTFTFSALDYAKAVVNSGMGGDQKDLAKSLYLYNKAANEYFDAAPAPVENEVISSGFIEDFSTLNVGDYIAKGVGYAADNDYKVVLTGGTYGTESRDGIVVRNDDYNFNAGEYGMGTYSYHVPQPNVFIEDYNENEKFYPAVNGVEGNAFVVVAKDDTQKIITIAGANVTQN